MSPREKLSHGQDMRQGGPEQNLQSCYQEASLWGGKSGSLEGTLCSQPRLTRGTKARVCGQGGGRGNVSLSRAEQRI